MTAAWLTPAVTRTRTKLPGHSRLPAFGNAAFSAIVPVFVSTVLFTNTSLPASGGPSAASRATCTLSVPRAASNAERLPSGKVKSTPIGSTWATFTSAVAAPGCARLPRCADNAPVSPPIGAVMRVWSTSTRVLSTSASAALYCASSASALLTLVSTALVE